MRRYRFEVSWSLPVVGSIVVLAACGGRSESAHQNRDHTSGAGGASASSEGGGAHVAGGMAGRASTSTSGGAGGGCAMDGVVYSSGQSFPAPDGCNSCRCDHGSITCTAAVCPENARCATLRDSHAASLLAAKACDARNDFQCQTLVSSSLSCGCPTLVSDPRAAFDYPIIEREWQELGCARNVECEPCPADPIGAFCSDERVCVDVR